ncbi:S24 family peptidase [Oceaniradius stylonematis]|uniref:S24 family peptidase n=1 Tax=Oceaniradius stylonematis TaxID=2184161 RepID=UPI00273EE79A|nr:S24 family peptidase [Oceaniradius stylonematis]
MPTLQEIAIDRLSQLGKGAVEVTSGTPLERTFVRDIVEGRKRTVRADKLFPLADALQLDPIALAHNQMVAATDQLAVPVISMVSAGGLRDQPGIMPEDVERWIRVGDLPAKGDWVAMGLEGDSMNRIAPDGSTILVNRADDTLIPGRFYVFVLETGEATFKRWMTDPARLQPYTDNPEHYAIVLSDQTAPYVFGRARRVLTDI